VWLQTGYGLDIGLTTCTHNSELQVTTALTLISTLYKSPQHPLSLSSACCVFNNRSLTTTSNSGDPSASRAHVVTVQRISRSWTLVNYQLNYGAISSQPPFQSSTEMPSLNWTHSPINYFISLHSTKLPSAGLGSSIYRLAADPTENTASNSSSIAVIGGCLAIARISVPRERVYRAAAKQRIFLLPIVA
jgi:hypothetical protein